MAQQFKSNPAGSGSITPPPKPIVTPDTHKGAAEETQSDGENIVEWLATRVSILESILENQESQTNNVIAGMEILQRSSDDDRRVILEQHQRTIEQQQRIFDLEQSVDL